MGFLALIRNSQARWKRRCAIHFARRGALAFFFGLSACSPQILGEKLSEQCELKGFSYSSASWTLIKNRESVSALPAFSEGVPLRFEITPALPSGVSMDPITGIISGLPTAVSARQNYTVRALSPSGCGVTQTLSLRVTGTDAVQSTLGVNRTQVAVGTTPDTTVTITFRDSKGQAVVGDQVSLVSSRPEDVITATSGSVTDANGQATFTLSSTLSGTATLTAVDVTDLETLNTTGSLEFTPGEARGVRFAGLATTLTAGTVVTVEVRASDSYGNRVPTVTGQVRVAHDDSFSSALGAGPTDLALSEGKALFNFKLTRAGTTTLSAQHLPPSGPALTSGGANVTVTPGPIDLTQTVILAPATTLTAGEVELFKIEPRDTFGNIGPTNTASLAEVVLNTASGSTGSVQLGTLTYNSIAMQFEIPVTGWTRGTLSLVPTLRGVDGVAQALTVNAGDLHHLELEGLPETTIAGTPISDLVLHAYDIADNRINPGALTLSPYVDSHCKVPTPGSPAQNSNRAEPIFDSDTERSTYSPLELYKTAIRHLGIQAPVPYCSPPIRVHPGSASDSQSILTFDYFPFEHSLAARSKIFPSAVQASIRAMILDQYGNPLPRQEVTFRKDRDLGGANFVYQDSETEQWGVDPLGGNTISLTTDQEGVIHLGLVSMVGDVHAGVYASSNRGASWLDQEVAVEFQSSLVPAGLFPGNLAGAGMVSVTGREPTPLVQATDTPSPPSEHPKWMVAIHSNSDTDPKTILCPGILLTRSRVLTPASCLVQKAAGLDSPLAVQAGSFWDPSVYTAYRQTRSIRRVEIDPAYDPKLPISDFALVEVSPPFDANPWIEEKGPRAGATPYLEDFQGYSWFKTNDWKPYAPDHVNGVSSYLQFSNQFEIKNTFTQSGIQNGNGSTFSMRYQTLGLRSDGQDLISFGQYAVLSDKNLSPLGFVVRTGDEADPARPGRTLDTFIEIQGDHPFVARAVGP